MQRMGAREENAQQGGGIEPMEEVKWEKMWVVAPKATLFPLH